MKFRTLIAGFALGCGTMLVAATALKQDPPTAEEMEKMWAEAMEKYCVPAKEHELLAERAGAWTFTAESWMEPGGEAMSFSGEASYEMVLDGRYLLGHHSGETPWGPFEGYGVTGFDRMTSKYVSTWIDNMSTAIMTNDGKATGPKTLEFSGEMPDPLSGKYVPTRSIEKSVDANTFVMEMFGPAPGTGKEYLSMRLTYKRKPTGG